MILKNTNIEDRERMLPPNVIEGYLSQDTYHRVSLVGIGASSGSTPSKNLLISLNAESCSDLESRMRVNSVRIVERLFFFACAWIIYFDFKSVVRGQRLRSLARQKSFTLIPFNDYSDFNGSKVERGNRVAHSQCLS